MPQSGRTETVDSAKEHAHLSREDLLSVIGVLQRSVNAAQEGRSEAAKTAKIAFICLGAALAVSAIAAAVVLTKYPMDRYVFTDNAKNICEAPTQAVPLVTTNTVTEFAKDCALDIDTYAYDSVERDLTRMADRCLVPDFRKNFFEAPWMASRIDTVQSGMLRVNSQTTGPVLVTQSGQTANGYMWRVQVPVKRTYRQGDAVKGSNERVYEIDVLRTVKDAFNPVALGISQVNEFTSRQR